jgi:hypothetical protein
VEAENSMGTRGLMEKALFSQETLTKKLFSLTKVRRI